MTPVTEKKEKTKYRTQTIDENLLDTIDIIVNNQKSLYKSRSEFIHDSIRRRIESLLALYPELKEKINASNKED